MYPAALRRHRAATALGMAAVLATATAATIAVAGPDTSQASTTASTALRAIGCDTAQGGTDFYDGPSASK